MATINAQVEDPRLEEIRATVARHTDSIPYVLLPLRIETRFMQVEKKAPEANATVESVLETMAFVQIEAINAQVSLTGDSVRTLTGDTNSLITLIQSMGLLLVKEKGWLRQLSGDMQKDMQAVVAASQSIFPADSQKLNTAITQLNAAVTGTKIVDLAALEPARVLIDRFITISNALQTLNGVNKKKAPYTDVKNKKTLYGYITSTLNTIKEFYQNIDTAIKALQYIDTTQRKRIQQLQADIQTQLGTLGASIEKMHTDAAWKKFAAETAQPEVTAIIALSNAFAAGSLLLLNNLPGPPAVQTGDVYFSGIKALVKIKRFNAQKQQGYEVIKKYKTYLEPRINSLAKTIQSPILESRPGQVSKLQNLFASINTEVTNSVTKINNYNAANKSQGAGKNLINTFFNQSVSSVIGGFAGQAVGNFPKPVYITDPPKMVNQLWVRIYPDDVFVQTHEEALSPTETDAGKQFWKVWWAAGGDKDLQMAAWQTLCKALGTHRASWVARVLNPSAIAANKAIFQTGPSSKIIDAITILTAINARLKQLPLDKPISNIVSATFAQKALAEVHTNLLKISTILSSLKQEQDFLLEKFRSNFINTAGLLNQLITSNQDLTGLKQKIAAAFVHSLHMMSGNLEIIQNALNKIKPVNHKDFVNAIDNPFVFPAVAAKDKDWTVAPHSNCLPDKFAVITMKDSQFTRIAVGNAVDETVQLGLDPQKFDDLSLFTIDADGNLNIDEGLKWMTDYNTAVSKGFGITLDITDDEYNNGFDRLIVLGIKGSDATSSKQLFEQLITNHIYGVDGLDFLKVGTPTNNTHEAASGWQSGNDSQQRYDIEINNLKYNLGETDIFKKADGKYFSDALGIDNAVTQFANYSGNLEMANAFAANRALWGVSLGHYMEEMWDGMFTYDNIRRTENFFTNYCVGRGIVPSVRIGMQPYGILATTAFSQLQLYPGNIPDLTIDEAKTILPWAVPSPALENKLQQRYEMRLYRLLNMLKNTWTSLRESNVIHSGNLEKEGDAQQRFVQMLGLNASSLDYFYRYAINIAKGPNASADGFGTNFKATDAFGPNGLTELFKNQILDGIFTPSFDFIDERWPGGLTTWQLTDAKYSRILHQFESSRLFIARLVENSLPVTGNLIDTIPDADNGLKSDYLSWLLTSGANSLLGGNAVGDPAKIPFDTMLFVMLRQSLLQGYQEAALNILQLEAILPELDRRIAGNTSHYHYKLFQNGKYVNKYLTKWHFLFKTLSDLVTDIALPSATTAKPFYQFIDQGPKSLANYLDRVKTANPALFNNSHKQFFDKLSLTRQAITTLKRATTKELDLLMAEHIDLCTYRLDSWLLGFVAKRLQQQRAKQPAGVFLGAYGYVENLRRDKGKDKFADQKTLANFKLDATKPVYHDTSNQGFIHGPSIGQAITAAVLRNAYMTNNTSAEDIANRLAVNISSGRVRMAMQLIEGIRNGQELGAILGFQFERGLHDRYKTIELDKYIQPLRKVFPLQQAVDETANGSATYISLVVNGTTILDKVHAAVDWPTNPAIKDDTIAELLKANNYAKFPKLITDVLDANLAGDNKNKVYDSIIEEIDRMADAFDALGDLAMSESVYQMVLGNHVRASAVLTALAEGKHMPDPQIIDTVRNGTVVTQRIILNFAATNNSFQLPAGWAAAPTVRSLTEPTFNNWLGLTLGPAKAIKYVLTAADANNNVTKTSFDIGASGLQAIDLFLVPGGESELSEIIISLYRKANNDYQSAISIDIKERDNGWSLDDKSLSEIYILMKYIRNMVSSAKYAGDSDIRLPNDPVNPDNPGNCDVDELNKRVTAAHKSLQLFIQDIATAAFLTDVLSGKTPVNDVVPTVAQVDTLFTYLHNAVFLGIPHALSIPFDAAATSDQRATGLLQQVVNIYKQAVAREAEATAAVTAMASVTSVKLKVQKLIELTKIVLGKNAIVNPLYTPLETTSIQKELALAPDKKIARNGGSLVMEDWLQNVSKVRERMYDLSMVIQTTDIYNLPVAQAEPVQLPYTDGDYWLGIEYPSAFTPVGDVISLVLLNTKQLQTAGIQSGFIVDEWLEIIPVREQTTGITFNYNNPNASPPQSILLAVTPEITNQWTWDDLVYTIIDTMDLAKNRAVEPDHFDKSFLGQVLPGIFSEVVPPQFRNEDTNPLGVQVVMDLADVVLPK
ncbi:hypothetical protein QWZ08_16980 [Ferruginibacter paludis]|uniref:hypothetical protein n=1 Tax=Ferruginibacter paludis TaxID=1310417 RepID=UPI0025B5EBB0|nr:hypothetical protein [Ferruginibacter paludis]MDN3657348.1 hypothetical protein [Ferruginibacter paludis]